MCTAVLCRVNLPDVWWEVIRYFWPVWKGEREGKGRRAFVRARGRAGSQGVGFEGWFSG